jgi:hypothetical protein
MITGFEPEVENDMDGMAANISVIRILRKAAVAFFIFTILRNV